MTVAQVFLPVLGFQHRNHTAKNGCATLLLLMLAPAASLAQAPRAAKLAAPPSYKDLRFPSLRQVEIP